LGEVTGKPKARLSASGKSTAFSEPGYVTLLLIHAIVTYAMPWSSSANPDSSYHTEKR
jgi:hypothetical protein